MKSIWIIAKNTFREIIRDRILYGLIVFALLLIGLSLALGELTFLEQARISANFGFTGIHISAVILAVFIGSSLVSREIEKQTILTLLARPISRTQFLLGKFFGLGAVIVTVLLGLAVVLAIVVSRLQLDVGAAFAIALFGILLEALILLSLVLFFGTFTRPIMAVTFTIAFFLIGHWVESLHFFAQRSTAASFKAIVRVFDFVLPNLERLNWRSLPIYNDPITSDEILRAIAYAGGWILFLIALTSIVFRRRDFV